MKTKVIEHEVVTIDPGDGDKDTDYLLAIKAPALKWEDKDGTQRTGIPQSWQINRTDLLIYGADEAREYIKLFEKIIEAEEKGD